MNVLGLALGNQRIRTLFAFTTASEDLSRPSPHRWRIALQHGGQAAFRQAGQAAKRDDGGRVKSLPLGQVDEIAKCLFGGRQDTIAGLAVDFGHDSDEHHPAEWGRSLAGPVVAAVREAGDPARRLGDQVVAIQGIRSRDVRAVIQNRHKLFRGCAAGQAVNARRVAGDHFLPHQTAQLDVQGVGIVAGDVGQFGDTEKRFPVLPVLEFQEPHPIKGFHVALTMLRIVAAALFKTNAPPPAVLMFFAASGSSCVAMIIWTALA